MAGTPNSTHADPRFEGGIGPAVAEDLLADFEEALARLVRESFAPAADLPDTDLAPAQRSHRKLTILARVAIAACVGAAAIGAWRVTTPPPIATSASAQAAPIARPAMTVASEPHAAVAERRQIEKTARDLANLRQAVDQLAAGQAQLTRRMGTLEAKKPKADAPAVKQPDKRRPRHVSAPPAPRVAARKPAAITPLPRPRRVSSVSRPSAPPRLTRQFQSEARLSEPPLRPPMPVPQP